MSFLRFLEEQSTSKSSVLTDEEIDLVVLTNTITTMISSIAELTLIITFFSVKRLRTFSFRLVISLVIADFGYSTSNIMSIWRANEFICIFSAYIRVFSICSGVWWASIISYVSFK